MSCFSLGCKPTRSIRLGVKPAPWSRRTSFIRIQDWWCWLDWTASHTVCTHLQMFVIFQSCARTGYVVKQMITGTLRTGWANYKGSKLAGEIRKTQTSLGLSHRFGLIIHRTSQQFCSLLASLALRRLIRLGLVAFYIHAQWLTPLESVLINRRHPSPCL